MDDHDKVSMLLPMLYEMGNHAEQLESLVNRFASASNDQQLKLEAAQALAHLQATVEGQIAAMELLIEAGGEGS